MRESHGEDRDALRRARVARSLLGVLAMLACSERGGEPVPDEGYFPLVAGAHWSYRVQSRLGPLELGVSLQGERDLPAGLPRAFLADERTARPVLGFAEVSPVAYLIEDGYVARIQGIGYDAEGRLRALGQSEATRILPVDPRPGQAWGQEHSIFDTPDGGGAQLAWTSEVRELTTVTVPAGTFDDVVEVVTRYYGSDAPPGEPTLIYRDYYARGVGLVKSRTEDPSGDASNTIEQVLLRYEFPGR